jgi:hypothetical protein
MQMMSDSIGITRVANGWVINMPRPYQRDDQPDNRLEGLSDSISKGMEGAIPILKQIMAMRQEDPLLAKLRAEAEEEEEQEERQDPKPLPAIGKDDFVFVCTSFADVLALLAEKFIPDNG